MDEKEKISFYDYLINLVGKKVAMKILKMSPDEKRANVIVIAGKQGSTGKSTLARVLRKMGYYALSPEEYFLIELNKEIGTQISHFDEKVIIS